MSAKRPTHAEYARTLVEARRTGTLSTVSRGDARGVAGAPFGSVVTFALVDGDPVFLISALAEHTKNLRGDARASLLVTEGDVNENPLALGRVTLVGEVTRVGPKATEGDPQHGAARQNVLDEKTKAVRAVYLEQNPDAAMYVDFADFAFYRLRVADVRYVGGFGRMSWVSADDFRAAEKDPIAPHAHGIVEHMNEDHADALVLYARCFAQKLSCEEATMISCDRYGFDMRVPGERARVRIAFPKPISTPDDARQAMIELLKVARGV